MIYSLSTVPKHAWFPKECIPAKLIYKKQVPTYFLNIPNIQLQLYLLIAHRALFFLNEYKLPLYMLANLHILGGLKTIS